MEVNELPLWYGKSYVYLHYSLNPLRTLDGHAIHAKELTGFHTRLCRSGYISACYRPLGVVGLGWPQHRLRRLHQSDTTRKVLYCKQRQTTHEKYWAAQEEGSPSAEMRLYRRHGVQVGVSLVVPKCFESCGRGDQGHHTHGRCMLPQLLRVGLGTGGVDGAPLGLRNLDLYGVQSKHT